MRSEANFALFAVPAAPEIASYAAAAAGGGQPAGPDQSAPAADAVGHTVWERTGPVQVAGGTAYRRRTAELIRELESLLGPHRGGSRQGGGAVRDGMRRGAGRSRNVVLRQAVELAQTLLRDEEVWCW